MANLLRKYLSLYSSTSNSFGTGTGETITPNSVSGLPTDTELILTFDYHKSDGSLQDASKIERIRGQITGGNFVISERGVDGTTDQAHTSPVVEMIWNAKDWNDFIDWALVSHNQTGYLKGSAVVASNISASAVTTGNLNFIPVTTTGSETLTNKRINKRILSATSYTTDTGTSLNCDTQDWFIVTAQAGDLKFNNPSGTPVDGQMLGIAVTGTAARALTWDTQFEASTTALPTTTVTTARLNMVFAWRADTSKWVCLAAA
jgi:hypothetical protein